MTARKKGKRGREKREKTIEERREARKSLEYVNERENEK